jgi:hypothetical protein
VDIPLTGTDFAPAVAALVIDKASRLIIGASTGMSSNTLILQKAALADASKFLEDHSLDRRDGAVETLVEMTVGTSTEGRHLELEGRLSTLPYVALLSAGPRRSGARANALLNGRLGGLRLLPHATFAGKMGGVAISHARNPLGLQAAETLVLEASSRHNSLIISNLRENIGADLVRKGSMRFAVDGLTSKMI